MRLRQLNDRYAAKQSAALSDSAAVRLHSAQSATDVFARTEPRIRQS